ncbi:MAG: MerR family transcriptional regulator [Solirubrobacterales bacterium]|nr:MerR family transcriptional regulator [Solirubrobacterales bacterium]
MEDRDHQLRVGELAERTGLTVRALHHYDEIGLLVPSERTYAGHRLYGPDDVRRLYRIVALRQLGLSLAEVAAALDGDGDVAATMRRQLAELDREIAERVGLRDRLERILGGIDGGGKVTVDDCLTAIERTTMIERHYTPEQLERLAARRDEIGEERIREVEEEWPRLFEQVEAAIDRGAAPDDPEVQRIAARMRELTAMFHGGDAGVRDSLDAVWRETPRAEMVAELERSGVADAERRVPKPEVMAFVARAHAAAAD